MNIFPLGSYSKPIAKIVGLEASVVLFEFASRYGNELFKIDSEMMDSLGIESRTWVLKKLFDNKFITLQDDYYRVNFEAFEFESTKPKTKKLSKECSLSIQLWQVHLKKKRGIDKPLGKLLIELEDKDEVDIIKAVQYSIDNGYTSLFFKDASTTDKGTGNPSVGEKTNADKGRDYTLLVKKAGE